MLRGLPMESRPCYFCTMRAGAWRSTGDSHPGHHRWCDCFQDSVLVWPDVLRVKWLPDVDSHHDEPLNRRSCYFDITEDLALPAGLAPALSRLEDGCLWSARPRELNEMVARPGAFPGLCRSGGYAGGAPRPRDGRYRGAHSSFQARPVEVSPRAVIENGGLCGHCSRDLPLDRRLLFVAELTGQ